MTGKYALPPAWTLLPSDANSSSCSDGQSSAMGGGYLVDIVRKKGVFFFKDSAFVGCRLSSALSVKTRRQTLRVRVDLALQGQLLPRLAFVCIPSRRHTHGGKDDTIQQRGRIHVCLQSFFRQVGTVKDLVNPANLSPPAASPLRVHGTRKDIRFS